MKIQVSQDTLYGYMTALDVKMTRLAELIGKSDDVVTSCFKHHKDIHGKPRRFNAYHIRDINQALPQIAAELQARLLKFGSEQTYTNRNGNTYDPALIDQLNNLGKYLNLTGIITRLLGWSKNKKGAVFCQPSSKAYGCISQQDAITINNEILSIIGVLSSYEVVPDEDGSSSSPDDTPIKTKKVRTRMEDTFSAVPHPWDDTALPLLDRYELFHREYPEGVLFFRVNSGYTVAQDDSRRLCELCSTLTPYTNPSDGLTTTYMDSDIFARLMPHCVGIGYRIAVTDMYANT